MDKRQPEHIICDGYEMWLMPGVGRHREDGPAYIGDGGGKSWWINGKLHRLDGPAVEYAGGAKEWWVNGMRHRTDGPAAEWPSGIKDWYVDGVKIECENNEQFLRLMKLRVFW